MADSSVTGEMGRSTPEQRTRAGKALRKSTQSCTECRRRKIRCSFPPNNRSLCIPCSSRGSRCIDQRNEHASAAMEDRKTLRDRVARLESLLETALHGKQEGDAMNFQEDGPDAAAESAKSAETDESEDGLDDEATSVPYMSALNDSMGSLDVEGNRQQNLGLFARPMTSSKLPQVHGNINHQQTDTTLASTENGASRKKTKQVRVCEELRSSLPKYDEMMEVCVQRGSWWPYWREKTYGDLKPVETLPQYASRVFINGTIWELGTLVSAFGLTTETKKSYYLAIVEKLLISDDQYAATLPGIECILLQGKCYLDIGQPRKAWLMYRRGLTVAQLSNLHRNHRKSVLADNLFWALYQGERFISILLNLPYSVNDIHCDLGQHPNSNTKGAGVPLRPLIIRCGMLAGKIIDRNQSNMEKSVSRTIEIDDEMQSTAEAMPPGWWDLPSARSDPSEDTAQIRQRLLLQVCFYLMRVHLNLPLLPDTQPNLDAGSERCRMSCIDSARLLVQRYNILRTVVDGKPLLDDSTNDFIGFTVAVILLIGASRKSSSPHLAAQAEEDWSLVEKTLVIFKNLSRYTPSSKLYKQAYRALDKLMSNQAVDGKDTKVFIPYLGTVHVRPDRRLQKPSGYSPSGPTLSYQSIRAAAIPTPGDMSKASSNSSLSYPNEGTAPEQSNRLDYEAPAMQHGEFSFSDPQYQIGENGLFYDAANFGTFAGGLDPFPWMDENVPMMDIDQDWTWMEQF